MKKSNDLNVAIQKMAAKIYHDLQMERAVVMNRNVMDCKFERALRKYDELAIRYDQMKKVLVLFNDDPDCSEDERIPV